MEFAAFMLSIISLFACAVAQSTSNTSNNECPIIQRLYQMGDSLSDTGNSVRIPPVGPLLPAARPPYGETFPGTPTGRWSDGRLIIDFIAMTFDLPLLNPYLAATASFTNGVNFAVAGSSALSPLFLALRGIIVPPNIPSLFDQVNQYLAYLATICFTPQACAQRLRNALIFLGEIGGNDINYAIVTPTQSLSQIRALVPYINRAIANAARIIINNGAQQIVVPGNFPIGCFLFAISARGTNDPTAYDELGCLKSLNNIAIYQNNDLQATLNTLRSEFPNVNIIYSDYYNAFLSVFRNAASIGFNSSTLLQACCGDAPYNLYGPNFCGNTGARLCPNPNTYIFWDGLHLTENAYRSVSQILISDLLMKINCTQ